MTLGQFLHTIARMPPKEVLTSIIMFYGATLGFLNILSFIEIAPHCKHQDDPNVTIISRIECVLRSGDSWVYIALGTAIILVFYLLLLRIIPYLRRQLGPLKPRNRDPDLEAELAANLQKSPDICLLIGTVPALGVDNFIAKLLKQLRISDVEKKTFVLKHLSFATDAPFKAFIRGRQRAGDDDYYGPMHWETYRDYCAQLLADLSLALRLKTKLHFYDNLQPWQLVILKDRMYVALSCDGDPKWLNAPIPSTSPLYHGFRKYFDEL